MATTATKTTKACEACGSYEATTERGGERIGSLGYSYAVCAACAHMIDAHGCGIYDAHGEDPCDDAEED